MGTYGQNGVAERAIGTVVNSACTMMLHQALLWPEHFDIRLWPFALHHTVYIWNRLPRIHGAAVPIEVYTSTTQNHDNLRNERVWGCPAYVLDPKMQDGKKIPKWDPKTRLG